MVSARSHEIVQKSPMSAGHLYVGKQWGAAGREKYKGAYRDRWEYWRPRHDVLESTGEAFGSQGDANLLTHLTKGGGQQIIVAGLAPATRKRHMPRPWVSSPVGSANQKNRVWIRGENDSNRGPQEGGIILVSWVVGG